jgi:uncharacterized membrane protein
MSKTAWCINVPGQIFVFHNVARSKCLCLWMWKRHYFCLWIWPKSQTFLFMSTHMEIFARNNYDIVNHKSISHTDFSTNPMKTYVFWALLGSIFQYLQSLSWFFGIPNLNNSLARPHWVNTVLNCAVVTWTVTRKSTPMSSIGTLPQPIMLSAKQELRYPSKCCWCYDCVDLSLKLADQKETAVFICR